MPGNNNVTPPTPSSPGMSGRGYKNTRVKPLKKSIEQKSESPVSTSQANQHCSLVLSFIVTVLFNHICGFFALYFTVSARISFMEKNAEKAQRYARYSTTCIVFGIILGVATYILAFSLYFSLAKDENSPSNSTVRTTIKPTSQWSEW